LPGTGGMAGHGGAPRENQGRLDFEQPYRENATFARKMMSNFQQNPEDATR